MSTAALQRSHDPHRSGWKSIHGHGHSRRRKAGSTQPESGFSAVELMLFTVPLCLLSMVLTSRLAATSQAKTKAQWQASLAAHQRAVNLCGGTPTLNGSWHSAQSTQKIHAIHGLSVPSVVDSAATANGLLVTYTGTGDVARVLSHITSVGNIVSDIGIGMNQLAALIEATGPFPTDVLQQQRLTDTNWSVATVTNPLGAFYFKPLSTRLLPRWPVNVAAGAAVICHELDSSTSPLTDIQTELLVFAFDEANRFYY
jgi:hypothetical protein